VSDWGMRQQKRVALIQKIARDRASIRQTLVSIRQFESRISPVVMLGKRGLGQQWLWAIGGAGLAWLFSRRRKKSPR